ncbi:MAG: ribokinase [Chloroflexi bacterium]|nr:ribokinase [Chloroflexota bacterium]
MQKTIITVVGSFAVGMTLRTSRMPIFGETLIGSDFDMGPGGKGSNQAVGVARLGAESHLVGIIGDDKLGEIATDLYAQEGVNTTHLKITKELATGVGFIILDQEGRNGIILDMSANQLMDEAFVDLAEDQIARSKVVMTVLEIPVAAAARAMELGRKHGILTVLNPAPAAPLSDQVLQNVDVITPNETELRILLGLAPDDPTSTLELAYRLRDRGAKNILVTMGDRGSLVLTQTLEVQVPSVQVKVVDTTGAGDSYNAGLAIALSEGKDIVEAARFAACTGALACTHLGVIPSLPARAAVEELYQKSFK